MILAAFWASPADFEDGKLGNQNKGKERSMTKQEQKLMTDLTWEVAHAREYILGVRTFALTHKLLRVDSKARGLQCMEKLLKRAKQTLAKQ